MEQDLDSKLIEKMLSDALKQAEEDVTEAQKHVDAVKKEIETESDNNKNLFRFSIMFQEALKVKGIARDRHIKLIRMIQDRVRGKEVAQATKGGVPWMLTPEAIQKMLDEASTKESNE